MRMYQFTVPAGLLLFAAIIGLLTLGTVNDILKILGVLASVGIITVLRPSRNPMIR